MVLEEQVVEFVQAGQNGVLLEWNGRVWKTMSSPTDLIRNNFV